MVGDQNQLSERAAAMAPPAPLGVGGRAKDEVRTRARDLRYQGWSYKRIATELGVSKSTVAHWVRPMPVQITEEERLNRLRIAAGKRSLALRRRASVRRQHDKLTASHDIRRLTDRELFLLGVGLYWAEGSKDKRHLGRRNQERVAFVNSDPTMIRVFIAWLALLGFATEDLTFHVQIHETADVQAAEAYWAEIVGVHVSEFRRTTLKRHKPATHRYNVGDRYRGCLSVTVRSSAALYRAIEGWWRGIAVAVEQQRPHTNEVRWGPRAPAAVGQGWSVRPLCANDREMATAGEARSGSRS